MISYIKTAITKPKEIYIGRNMKNSHFFSILLSLVIALTFFSLFEFYPTFREINKDITEVKQAIPEFALENNKLESDSESFIYQTDTLFLYFDPENQMSTEMIDRNMRTLPVPISIGLLHEEFSLNVAGQHFSLRYAELTDFTTKDLKLLIDRFGEFSPSFLLVLVLFLFIFNFFLFLVQFFPIVLFANIISVYRRSGFRFYQTVKVALLATILPIMTLYVVNAFLFNVYFQFELLIGFAVLIYSLTISEMKERIQKQRHIDD